MLELKYRVETISKIKQVKFIFFYEVFNYNCSMTFCFFFEVFVKLNPIQVNIKRGRPTYKYKAKRRDEDRTITS